MQATIIRQLQQLPALGIKLSQYLTNQLQNVPLHTFSTTGLRAITSALSNTTCQTRNLLHYKHLQDRIQVERCFSLLLDVFSKIIQHRPEINEHLMQEFTNHILHHTTCYISLAFYLQLVRKHSASIPTQRLLKLINKVVSCLEEAGQVQFLEDMERGPVSDWETARRSLEVQLLKRSPPKKPKESQRSQVSQSKIPPLVLPSFKPIGSSRYSAMSREEQAKGLAGLRQLGRSIGEGFVAVELGCLLAHKRTRQVQELADNSDYRSKCLERAETERGLVSWWTEGGDRGVVDRQMEQTNRRYYRRVLDVLFNLVALGFDSTQPTYDPQPLLQFIGSLLNLIEIGVVDVWSEPIGPPYLATINLKLRSMPAIFAEWSEQVSFATEKRHIRMLANRGRKGALYSFEEGISQREIRGKGIMRDVSATRMEHLELRHGGSPAASLQDRRQSDWMLLDIARRSCSLVTLCNMSSPRFYKYQANLLSALAAYLTHSFSATTKYLTLDLFFPYLALVKREVVELSHPYPDALGSSTRSSPRPLFAEHPSLFCALLRVLGALLCNQKHVQKLLSGVFLKCGAFMETLQRYVGFLFEQDMREEILGVLGLYRRCLQTYSHRKMRNTESRSMKILLSHLAGYLYPRVGCIWSRLEATGVGQGSEEEGFIGELVCFVREVFQYCEEQVGEALLEQQIACHYVRYSFLNFVKLYSSLTVAELGALAGDQGQPPTKESPHSRPNSHRTPLMLNFLGILTNLALHRNGPIAKTLKQYRVLQFMAREYELQFQLKENIEKYVKKVAKPKEVPKLKKQSPKKKIKSESKDDKIPSLNLKAESFKLKTAPEEPLKEKLPKKGVPTLKLPTRSQRSEGERLVLDGLLEQIRRGDGPEREEGMTEGVSSERGVIYDSERRVRKIYCNGQLQGAGVLLILSLLLKNGQLDPDYCDQFPVSHGKINVLYLLHHHLNHPANSSLLPLLAQGVQRIKPFLAGQRLLKLLAAPFTDLTHYSDWRKVSSGAYGVIYACHTQLHDPSEVAIKELPFPRSIYQRCVLHDIFSEISCLEGLRLDDRVTTMYNYGVTNSAYVIIMRKYDCSLRDWVRNSRLGEGGLVALMPSLLKVFGEILQIVLLLHEQSVTHYDLKADNLLLLLSPEGIPTRVAVGDFGQCRLFPYPHPELDMKSRGTECIKSPQMLTLALQLKKESDSYDRRKKVGTTRASDIWSLGCLFYEIMTGQFLFHRPDWVNFYVQVTNSSEDLLDADSLARLDCFPNCHAMIDFLRSCLVRQPQHRPQIRAVIQKYKSLFGEARQQLMKVERGIETEVDELVGLYLKETSECEEQDEEGELCSGVRGSRCNRYMRIMEDIWFVEGLQGKEGTSIARQLGITHVVTTKENPLLGRFNVLRIERGGIGAGIVMSELLREVLLLKGKLLVVNDSENHAASLLVYCLSYWFRCSLYETWCLINTQSLLFPALTSRLRQLAKPLHTLSLIEKRVQVFPKLQCICGSVTLILKHLPNRQKGDFSCKCKPKQLHHWNHRMNAPECPSRGCQSYLDIVKKRYSIAWECLRWAKLSHQILLTPISSQDEQSIARTQVLLNGDQPISNMIDVGSCITGWKILSCRVCEMMMCASGENGQLMVVMNNMLRRVRQGIMVPNAQERYAKRAPALANYTLTKLHLTQPTLTS